MTDQSQSQSDSGNTAPSSPAAIDLAACEEALATIEAQLAVIMGRPERVVEACEELRRRWRDRVDDPVVLQSCRRLLPLLARRQGPMADALFAFSEELALELADPAPVLHELLQAADPALRTRALGLTLHLTETRRLALDIALGIRVATVLETPDSQDCGPTMLARLARAVRHGSVLGQFRTGEDPVEGLFLRGQPRALRYLAARLLDVEDGPVGIDRVARLLGQDTAAVLEPYLDYTRATHRDLIDLTPEPGAPPPVLPGLVAAERVMGRALLCQVLGELGWVRVAWGLSARRVVGVSVDGSIPFVLAPAEAELIEACGSARRQWDRFLVVAHGGTSSVTEVGGQRAAEIERFRRYSVVHAETLGDFLEVAPLSAAKVTRLIGRLDEIVADFEALFAAHTPEARQVAVVYAALRAKILDRVGSAPPDEPLSSELTRLVLMFEDAQRLDQVSTLHSLKRYVHQQGLRLAFQLFRSGQATNRTVDLVLASSRRVLRVVQRIRYIDFEPSDRDDPTALPFPVSVAVEGLERQLLQRLETLPYIEILSYGSEVQFYVSFRNHPAFVRVDFSPPARGGMIDLAYYAVSQYDVEHHPDLSLASMQQLLRRLEFDVGKEDLRLRVRYDKERAQGLDELLNQVRLLFWLVPYLMDVDWAIGGLAYPEPVRLAIAEAWADVLARWGCLPISDLLTSNRLRILCDVVPTTTGRQEVWWDGIGPYRDQYSRTPRDEFWDRLRAVLESRGLGQLGRWEEQAGAGIGQVPLERVVLEPLRRAIARGEVVEADGTLGPAPAATFTREHEADRFAQMLAAGGAALERAVHLASLVRRIERQLRFRTTGSVQGYPVQRAVLPLRAERIGLCVLRDATGIARLAIATRGDVALYRRRTTPGGVWEHEPQLDAAQLMLRLARDNYVARDDEVSFDSSLEAKGLAARFRIPNPKAPPRLAPEDRIVAGTAASPGRATGFARLGTVGRRIDDFDGAVLVAPVIRPEDAPLLRRAAGIVGTGGGILSHAGAVALELQKPALIITGRWDQAAAPKLLWYKRTEFAEHEEDASGLRVIRRRDMGEREEVLQEGDLVVVDADAGILEVLGQDREALAMHQELSQLEEAARRLDAVSEAQEVLLYRGRVLRSSHQLEKLLAKVVRPALARYATRELVLGHEAFASPTCRAVHIALMRALLANEACGEAVRAVAKTTFEDLVRHAEAVGQQAVAAFASLSTVLEVLFTRLGVIRAQDAVDYTHRLLSSVGLLSSRPVGHIDIDGPATARLREFSRHVTDALAARAGHLESDTDVRHLLPQLDQLDEVLSGPPVVDPVGRGRLRHHLEEADRATIARLSDRLLIESHEGGRELRPLVGGKAANLGEVVRVIGQRGVPPWFALTDAAFRRMLQEPPPKTVEEGLVAPECATLGEAIEAVVKGRDMDAGHKALAVRHLWKASTLPPDIAGRVTRAYAALAALDPSSGPEAAPGDPFVAIRSSALEEDTEGAAWAGEFDTFLYISGTEALIEHLKLAWAGLWTERAIVHRSLPHVSGSAIGGGVIVQRIVRARVSGVLHTASAASGQPGEMIINVGLGLGEGVVSGTVGVDDIAVSKGPGPLTSPLWFRYRVGDKRERVVFDRRAGIGTRREETLYHQRLRPALEYSELRELVRTAAQVEEAYGHPLDIEFAFEDQTLWILQARPIPVFNHALRDTLIRHPLSGSSAQKHV